MRQYQVKKERMAVGQSIAQAIRQVAIKAVKVEIIADRQADNLVNNVRPIHTA